MVHEVRGNNCWMVVNPIQMKSFCVKKARLGEDICTESIMSNWWMVVNPIQMKTLMNKSAWTSTHRRRKNGITLHLTTWTSQPILYNYFRSWKVTRPWNGLYCSNSFYLIQWYALLVRIWEKKKKSKGQPKFVLHKLKEPLSMCTSTRSIGKFFPRQANSTVYVLWEYAAA